LFGTGSFWAILLIEIIHRIFWLEADLHWHAGTKKMLLSRQNITYRLLNGPLRERMKMLENKLIIERLMMKAL
jgi:hypothetical protein